MAKSGVGRFLTVFAIVFVIGQLVWALSFILFRGPGTRSVPGIESFPEMVMAFVGSIVALFPGPIIPVILISVFAMNRIRSLWLIALAATLALLFLGWALLRGGAVRIAFGFVEFVNRWLESGFSAPLSDDLQIALHSVILVVVVFGISFLIIKLGAAAEKRMAGAPAETA